MRRPRCGTCRYWVPDEGPLPFCSLVPPAPVQDPSQPKSTHPIAAHWGGCAQHKHAFWRSVKAVWARVCLKPGNDPKRMNRQRAKKEAK